MIIKEIRSLTGLSQNKFAEAYSIPPNNIRNWEQGARECPTYVLDLLEFRVKYDIKRRKNGMRDFELLKDEIKNSDMCVVTEDDIKEYEESLFDVRFVATVDMYSREFADAACQDFSGKREFEEYNVEGYSLYVAK